MVNQSGANGISQDVNGGPKSVIITERLPILQNHSCVLYKEICCLGEYILFILLLYLSKSQSTARIMVTSSAGKPTVSKTITIVTNPA